MRSVAGGESYHALHCRLHATVGRGVTRLSALRDFYSFLATVEFLSVSITFSRLLFYSSAGGTIVLDVRVVCPLWICASALACQKLRGRDAGGSRRTPLTASLRADKDHSRT